MLFLVIISYICLSVNGWGWGDFVDTVKDAGEAIADGVQGIPNEVVNVINQIPNLPVFGEYLKVAQCAIESGKTVLNPTSTIINDGTIIIQNKFKMINECSGIITEARKIIGGDKNAYYNFAKDFFKYCTNLNAGIITIEYGVGVAGLVGISGSIGLAIETSTGKLYSYISGCVGVQSDITADGGYTLSLFDGGINDVAGCSKYYAVGFDVNVMGVEVASMDKMLIYNLPSERIIARGIGYGVGVGGNPWSVENGYCYTFDPIYMVNLNDLNK